MDLHDWALSLRLMTFDNYKRTIEAQVRGSVDGIKFDNAGLVDSGDNNDVHSNLIRKHPIGDVLDNLPFKNEIYDRAGVANLEGLVTKWQQWHVDNIEPIATYSTSTRVGKNVYTRQEEKRLVARFVNQARVGTGPLIRNSDTVVIPEGSSAFYVGLAIAALREHVSIVTSNMLLCREYYDNPALAKSFKGFYVIGGLSDKDPDVQRSEYGGVFGPDAQTGYETAITERPTATVVIMPVSGLLPQDGPYATEEFIRNLKYAIIRSSLDAKVKVREFVFIADYSKHLPSDAESYGAPILEREDWSRILTQNKRRMSLVTVPPPILREALVSSDYSHPVSRSLEAIKSSQPFTDTDRAYCKSCSEVANLFNDGGAKLTFHEALSEEVARKSGKPSLAAV